MLLDKMVRSFYAQGLISRRDQTILLDLVRLQALAFSPEAYTVLESEFNRRLLELELVFAANSFSSGVEISLGGSR